MQIPHILVGAVPLLALPVDTSIALCCMPLVDRAGHGLKQLHLVDPVCGRE